MFRQLYTNSVWKSNSSVLMKLSSPTWKNERPLFGQMFNIAPLDAGRVLGRRRTYVVVLTIKVRFLNHYIQRK
jgi:hypothetical protein